MGELQGRARKSLSRILELGSEICKHVFKDAVSSLVVMDFPPKKAVCESSSTGRVPSFQVGCCGFEPRLSLDLKYDRLQVHGASFDLRQLIVAVRTEPRDSCQLMGL